MDFYLFATNHNFLHNQLDEIRMKILHIQGMTMRRLVEFFSTSSNDINRMVQTTGDVTRKKNEKKNAFLSRRVMIFDIKRDLNALTHGLLESIVKQQNPSVI